MDDYVKRILKENLNVIKFFVEAVNQLAEQKMLTSHKLEGMHHASIKQIIKELEEFED